MKPQVSIFGGITCVYTESDKFELTISRTATNLLRFSRLILSFNLISHESGLNFLVFWFTIDKFFPCWGLKGLNQRHQMVAEIFSTNYLHLDSIKFINKSADHPSQHGKFQATNCQLRSRNQFASMESSGIIELTLFPPPRGSLGRRRARYWKHISIFGH